MPFPVEGKFIRATEEKLGVKFPLSFLARMQSANGDEICACEETWQLHPFFDDSDKKRLIRTCNDIVRETMSERLLNWFPKDGVAIGDNGTGDKLIFRADVEKPGRLANVVFWWFHGSGECKKIADDFEQLMELESR